MHSPLSINVHSPITFFRQTPSLNFIPQEAAGRDGCGDCGDGGSLRKIQNPQLCSSPRAAVDYPAPPAKRQAQALASEVAPRHNHTSRSSGELSQRCAATAKTAPPAPPTDGGGGEHSWPNPTLVDFLAASAWTRQWAGGLCGGGGGAAAAGGTAAEDLLRLVIHGGAGVHHGGLFSHAAARDAAVAATPISHWGIPPPPSLGRAPLAGLYLPSPWPLQSLPATLAPAERSPALLEAMAAAKRTRWSLDIDPADLF